ncbi:hypothetical protein MCEMIH16_02006 [Caulobacteraceae bacterium]
MPSRKGPPLQYSTVNRAINEVIFDGRFKLAPIYIDIEGDVEIDLSAGLDLKLGECTRAIAHSVAATMKWASHDPYSWHLAELRAWNELERPEAPPFSALLTVLSLAAERMRADEDYSAQNYYERLFEVLEVETDDRKNALKHNAKSVLPFWQALNRWLAEHDFEFGRPTAQPINHWQYAGYALSQALVRDADRKRLHGLFADYGLAPKEILTTAEMSLYLHEWMGGSAPSAWLRKIWNSPDLRPRVAAAACSELEAWEGSTETTGQMRRRLSWAASLQDFPKPRLRLFLSASDDRDDGAPPPHLQLSGTVSSATAAAFADCPDGVHLTPSISGGVAVIEPVSRLALSPLMLASFELEDPDTGLKFQRAARAIVPLVKLDTGPFFREVSRVSFLRPHLVLCHVQWRERVEKLLERNARQGFKVHTPETLQGLASDWLLFTGVELLRLPQAADANMQALVPLSEGVSVEAAGGLRLSGGLWHSQAPPEITAAGQASPMVMQLKDADDKVVGQAMVKATSCRLTLTPDLELDARDLTLFVHEGDRLRREVSFSFRSAVHPRRLPQGVAPAYWLAASNPRGLLSTDAVESLPGATPVHGLDAGGVTVTAFSPPIGLATGGLPAAEEEAPETAEGSYMLNAVSGLEETCVLRGFHVWDCQEFRDGDDPRGDMWMTCRACANRVLTRNRGSVPKRFQKGPRRGAAAAPALTPPGMRPRHPAAIEPQTVFDALCYLGHGSWRKFQDLAGINVQELEVQRFLQDLFALGHLDLAYDQRLRSPSAWRVPAPVICAVEGGVYAAGFRNAPLLADLAKRLGGGGGQLDIEPLENAPPRYFWSGISAEQAAFLLEGLADPHQRPVKVVGDPGTTIVAAAPAINELIPQMAAIRLETPEDLQRFDLGSGRWKNAESSSEPGAYRGGYGGRRYVFTSPDGSQTEGPYALVKLMAARHAGLRLHEYRPTKAEFHAVLGCEPLGLFHRALTSFTGRPPSVVQGRLVYAGVPLEAASLILSKLYG